jgi:NAD-dependent deacetylase
MRDLAATRPTERAGRRSLALRDGSARLEAASPVSDALRRLAELVLDARRTVAFTGAGVSTESGIPDFRSPGGLWDRFDPSEFTYQNFMGSLAGRRKYWALGRVTYPVIRAARPNGAHLALAELHRLDRLDCCITQNIDDLHQRAGLPAEKVIELHGNATRTRCLACGIAYTRDEVHEWLEERDGLPACPACGGVVKPTTVLFGEPMPAAELREGERRARAADLFVVLGSSLGVYPAAYMPAHAKHAGATLAIVNLEPTPLDGQADLVIREKASVAMAAVLQEVRARTPRVQDPAERAAALGRRPAS